MREVGAGADGFEGIGDQLLPGVHARVKQVLVIVVGPVAQVVALQARPQPLHRVELGL